MVNIAIDFIKSHCNSIFYEKWTWKRLRRAYVLFQARQSRGGSFTGEITGFLKDVGLYNLAFVTLNGIFGWNIPNLFIIFFAVGYFMFTYSLGFIDQHYLKIWQTESEFSYNEINPYFQKLDVDIHEIKEMLKCRNKKKQR